MTEENPESQQGTESLDEVAKKASGKAKRIIGAAAAGAALTAGALIASESADPEPVKPVIQEVNELVQSESPPEQSETTGHEAPASDSAPTESANTEWVEIDKQPVIIGEPPDGSPPESAPPVEIDETPKTIGQGPDG